MTGSTVRVGRLTVALSHPGKVFFPADSITKGDLVAYYQRVAGLMLPFLRDRPISMTRYPDGITAGGIVQKNVPRTSRTGSPGRGCARRAARCSRSSATSQPRWCTSPTRPASRCTRS